MKDLTLQEYNAEIQSLARTTREEAGTGDIDEAIAEAVDSHQWIIYNAYHLDVLKLSDHEHEGIDEGLIDANAALKEGGLYKLTGQLAYHAMVADVREALDDLDDEPAADAEGQ